MKTGGTFDIPTTLTAGTYHYLCQATIEGANPVNSGVASVTVNAPAPAATSVTVDPATVSIEKGGNYTFTATVTGTNGPAQTVNWSVTGGTSASTAISTSGVLSVGSDEAATTLTVKATSTFDPAKSGTATVTVTTPTSPSSPSSSAESPSVQYQIVKGQNGVWANGSANGLGFTANVDYGKFVGAMVDGVWISRDNYTAQSGSTIVTLKDSYLRTLSPGLHTLRIGFIDGYAETRFTVNGFTDIPKTGDNSTLLLWLGLALIAGTGLTASHTRRKRQNG